jgi:hypothetical protein
MYFVFKELNDLICNSTHFTLSVRHKNVLFCICNLSLFTCNYYELCVLMGKKWACEMWGMYHEWCVVEVIHDYDMIEKWV